MLYLKNVRKEKNKILADYYPEDSNISTVAEIDIDEPENCTVIPTGYDKEYRGHVEHAKYALRDMVKGNRTIADCVVMWY